jgi:hypothetical protein
MSVAQLYAELGEVDSAFFWLEKGTASRSPLVMFLRVDPRFDNLRSDARFADLLKRVELPP